jgi:GTP-dependent dephospho-CoA kinase
LRRVFRLPERMRQKLGRPLGQVFRGEEVDSAEFKRLVSESKFVVTVGDRVTDTIGALGRTPDVQVVDGVERRKRREPPMVPFSRLVTVVNPAGTLTSEAIDGMQTAFVGKKPVRVLVEGEEDLMTVLAVAMAPVSAVIFYGQPGEGVVAIKADATTKSRNREILSKMGIKGIGRGSSS